MRNISPINNDNVDMYQSGNLRSSMNNLSKNKNISPNNNDLYNSGHLRKSEISPINTDYIVEDKSIVPPKIKQL